MEISGIDIILIIAISVNILVWCVSEFIRKEWDVAIASLGWVVALLEVIKRLGA